MGCDACQYEFGYSEHVRFLFGAASNSTFEKQVKMDKQIRKLEKEEKKVGKGLKELEKADKKRDKVCDYGEKMMKQKKK